MRATDSNKEEKNMKKTVLFLCIAVLALGLTACKGGGGKYSDVIKVMDKYVASIEKFATSLDGAKSADDVAAALDSLTAVTKELAPDMKALETKYPELKDQQQNPPEALKPIMDKVMAAGTKMMGAMSKVMQYAQDPKVMEAQKKYAEAMALTK
jgi:hypothetical protein